MPTRLRAGIILGFAAGYYLGTKAGQERYRQINRIVSNARHSDTLDVAAHKLRAALSLGRERARDIRGARRAQTNGTGPPAPARY